MEGCYCCTVVTTVIAMLIGGALLHSSVMFKHQVSGFRSSNPESDMITKFCETNAEDAVCAIRKKEIIVFALGTGIGAAQVLACLCCIICIEDVWIPWSILHALIAGGSAFLVYIIVTNVLAVDVSSVSNGTQYINAPNQTSNSLTSTNALDFLWKVKGTGRIILLLSASDSILSLVACIVQVLANCCLAS